MFLVQGGIANAFDVPGVSLLLRHAIQDQVKHWKQRKKVSKKKEKIKKEKRTVPEKERKKRKKWKKLIKRKKKE